MECIQLIPQNKSKNYIAIELLKTLATREDENVLEKVAETLSLGEFTSGNKKWQIEFDNIEDFIDIVNNFVRLSRLNYATEECLIILGKTHPWEVIEFIKNRLKREQELSREIYYDAIPSPCSIFENWKFKPEYTDILRHFRDWVLEEDYIFAYKIFDFIKNLSPQLKTYLENNFENLIFNSWQYVSGKLWYAYLLNKYRVEYIDCQLYEVLMKWVNSGEREKIKVVARILREGFNEKQGFYDLSREIIIKSKGNEDITSYISSAISSTPGVIVGASSVLSDFYRRRQQEISFWLEDENVFVRDFAQDMKNKLGEDIQREEARNKLSE